MTVWVLNPPYHRHFSRPQRSPAVTKSGTLYFPIWLAGCVGVLERAGHRVVFTDAPAADLDRSKVISMTERIQPDLIVVDTSTPSINSDCDLCVGIKAVLPRAFIVLVGTHVSALPGEILESWDSIDGVARREYDLTILELSDLIDTNPDWMDGTALAAVKGLSFRSRGGIFHNPDRPFINDPDELPWVSPVYERHLNIRDYFNPNALFPMVTIMTSRGCPFRCSFCVYPQTLTGRQFRYRSIDDVILEIIYIKKQFPDVKSVFFEDDTLSANKKRLHSLAGALIDADIRLSWTANSRIELDYETLLLMRKAGCRSLCVGFESGEQSVLDSMGKGIQKKRMFRFVKDAKKAGILIHGCFMVGFPGETERHINKTVDLALALNPDTAQFYPVMVYPGTEAFKEYEQKGWIAAKGYDEWLTPEGLHNCVVRNETFSPEELVAICDRARKRFYLRGGFVISKFLQIVKKPSEAGRIIKAFKTFYKHLFKGLIR